MTAVTSGVAITALPATIEIYARPHDGNLPYVGRIHHPLPTTTYCSRCGATDNPTALYTLAPRGAMAPEPA